jgi:hypothetical protein
MNATLSQSRAILTALQAGDTLTHLEAERRFGCSRIAARIADIRAGKADGIKYDKDTLLSEKIRVNGKTVARYRLRSPRLKLIESIPVYKPVAPKPTNLLF